MGSHLEHNIREKEDACGRCCGANDGYSAGGALHPLLNLREERAANEGSKKDSHYLHASAS